MVGLFINAIPVRVQIPPADSVFDWLNVQQTELAELLRHGYAPLMQIQSWNGIPRNKPMFDYILVDQSYPGPTSDQNLSYALFEVTGYPLTVYLNLDTGLVLQINYDRQRFDNDDIARTLRHMHTLLFGMVADPHQRLSQVPILTEAERHQLLNEWNETQADYPAEATIQELFEAQVRKSSDTVAVVFEDQHLTYWELNRHANQLAHYLQALGVAPEACVGIFLERSLEMIVSILATLKAGGVYVPIDPAHPPDRLTFILEDTQTPVLLTQNQLLKRLSEHKAHVICLDTDGPAIAQECEENLAHSTTAENLAYVVYTSGSTGRPKGVMVAHDSLINIYLAWENAYQLKTECNCHLQMASFSFDVFSGDLVRALCSGAKLVLCPRELLLTPDELYDLMRREKVDCGEFVPVVVRSLVEYLQETGQSLDFMRLLVVGSDSWYMQEYHHLRSFCGPETRLINSYGLSETTIDSSYFASTVLDLCTDVLVPIGRPFANTEIYLLDFYLRPVPLGVPGELYVGGDGISRGYLNRFGLTAERFVPNLFSGKLGTRLYKTGDLVRYLPDGNLEFVGRIDHQVKIRGFRVELGEIESVLSQHPAVQETVVLAHENTPDRKQLVAYIVPGEAQTQDLRGFLRERLPDYMVPSIFVPLDALPLTPSGKVDRRALPAPDGAQPARLEEFVPPETPLEEKLAEIWTEVLRIERIGIFDNFFDLGGNSLLGTQIISRISKALRVKVPMYHLFKGPTIANLALAIEEILIEEVEAVS